MKQPPDFLQWEEKEKPREIGASFDSEPEGLYRHDKSPKSYYLHRSVCVRAMCQVGASKLYCSVGEDWQQVPLNVYEKETLRRSKMLRWNKNVSL